MTLMIFVHSVYREQTPREGQDVGKASGAKHPDGSGCWLLGNGPWPWPMGHGPWAMAHGPWAMGHGPCHGPCMPWPWLVGHDPCHGPWPMPWPWPVVWAMSDEQWATQLFEANILTCQDVGGALRMLTS